MTKLSLPQVTLFTTCPPELFELTINSVRTCQFLTNFAETIISVEKSGIERPEAERIDGLTLIEITPVGKANEAGKWFFRELPGIIKTSHILNIEWDSWITNPDLWCQEWLEYDYIGARWPWRPEGQNIGNGGFSLISKRLMETVKRLRLLEESQGLDTEIGTVWRQQLESEGIKYPPTAIADRFSYERTVPDGPTFGFHGMFNWWREMPDHVLCELDFPRYVTRKIEYAELMGTYAQMRKWKCVEALQRQLIK